MQKEVKLDLLSLKVILSKNYIRFDCKLNFAQIWFMDLNKFAVKVSMHTLAIIKQAHMHARSHAHMPSL